MKFCSHISVEATKLSSLDGQIPKGWHYDGLLSKKKSLGATNYRLNHLACSLRGGGDGDDIQLPESGTNEESDVLSQIVDDIQDVWEDIIEDFSDAAFAGKIFPILSKLLIRPETARRIYTALKSTISVGDLLFILIVGWTTVPVLQFLYDQFVYTAPVVESHSQNITTIADDSATEKEDSTEKINSSEDHITPTFKNTFLFHFADHIGQAGKIAGLVYVIDCFSIIVKCMGFDVKNYSQVIAKIIYTVWTYLRIQDFKSYLVKRLFDVSKVRKGRNSRKHLEENVVNARANLVNHLLNGFIYIALVFAIVDTLQVEGGFAVKSILTFGSAGTFVLSLASQDLAKQLVSGVALSTSTQFFEGEEVVFGNGVSGVVEGLVSETDNNIYKKSLSNVMLCVIHEMKLFWFYIFFFIFQGWMQTKIRSQDGSVLSIPNTMLANQKFSNLSRTKKSQIKQTLKFRYEDAERLPQILHDIKKEIIKACPSVITDGSRPFHVVWTDYEGDHLKVMVDINFNLPPTGDIYHNNRQRCLMAILRAMKNNVVEFA